MILRYKKKTSDDLRHLIFEARLKILNKTYVRAIDDGEMGIARDILIDIKMMEESKRYYDYLSEVAKT